MRHISSLISEGWIAHRGRFTGREEDDDDDDEEEEGGCGWPSSCLPSGRSKRESRRDLKDSSRLSWERMNSLSIPLDPPSGMEVFWRHTGHGMGFDATADEEEEAARASRQAEQKE